MNGNDQLIEQLAGLDDVDFATVVERARRQRTAHRPPPPERPHEFNRDSLARWYATRHLSIEPTIREIIYLPEGAPDNEIRLMEVNTLSMIPDDAPVEAIDFRVDMDLPGEHRLFVADVSPGQWERIRVGSLELPAGWRLENNQIFGRRRRG